MILLYHKKIRKYILLKFVTKRYEKIESESLIETSVESVKKDTAINCVQEDEDSSLLIVSFKPTL